MRSYQNEIRQLKTEIKHKVKFKKSDLKKNKRLIQNLKYWRHSALENEVSLKDPGLTNDLVKIYSNLTNLTINCTQMLLNGQYCKPCKYDLQPGEEAIQDSMVRNSKCYGNIDTLHPMKIENSDSDMTHRTFDEYSQIGNINRTLTTETRSEHKVRLKQLRVLKSGHMIKHKVRF
jgi:hypothetical protein